MTMTRAELDLVLGFAASDEQWQCISAPLEPFVSIRKESLLSDQRKAVRPARARRTCPRPKRAWRRSTARHPYCQTKPLGPRVRGAGPWRIGPR